MAARPPGPARTRPTQAPAARRRRAGAPPPPQRTAADPRHAAAVALARVREQRKALEGALADAPGFAALETRDRAFARMLAATALRHAGEIDAVIARLVERPLPEEARAVSDVLALGIVQLLYLDTPAHAAVATSVALCEARRVGKFKGLVNAVLRRVAREGRALIAGLDAARVNTPDWLWQGWCTAYGEETAHAIAVSHLVEPPLDLAPRDAGSGLGLAAALDAEVLPWGALRRRGGGNAALVSDSRAKRGGGGNAALVGDSRAKRGGGDNAALVSDSRAKRGGGGNAALVGDSRAKRGGGGAIPDLPGYADGTWWVQDGAAQIPARLLGPVAGKRVLDLCAAPGGKTLQLAAAGGDVTAVDRSRARLDMVAANLARTGLVAALVAADGRSFAAPPFDAVLLDAPCTATGTMRRHPDIARTRRAGDIAGAAAVQDQLLDNAARLTRPGGVLVYAACSLEPAECEARIAAFLDRHRDFTADPIGASEVPGLAEAVTAAGQLRTLPCMMADRGGIDGFFAARLRRSGEAAT